jgi:hypothetical protein
MNQPTDFIRLSAWRVFKECSIGQRYNNYQPSIPLISYKGYSTYRDNFWHSPICTSFVTDRRQLFITTQFIIPTSITSFTPFIMTNLCSTTVVSINITILECQFCTNMDLVRHQFGRTRDAMGPRSSETQLVGESWCKVQRRTRHPYLRGAHAIVYTCLRLESTNARQGCERELGHTQSKPQPDSLP